MDINYKITTVDEGSPSNYPDSKKYKFMLEGYDHEVSAFSKFPMTVGQEVFGHIDVVGQYHNFKWGKKSTATFQKAGAGFQPTPDLLRVERKMDTIITEIGIVKGTLNDIKGVLGGLLQEKSPF